jgi:hypothetical protein
MMRKFAISLVKPAILASLASPFTDEPPSPGVHGYRGISSRCRRALSLRIAIKSAALISASYSDRSAALRLPSFARSPSVSIRACTGGSTQKATRRRADSSSRQWLNVSEDCQARLPYSRPHVNTRNECGRKKAPCKRSATFAYLRGVWRDRPYAKAARRRPAGIAGRRESEKISDRNNARESSGPSVVPVHEEGEERRRAHWRVLSSMNESACLPVHAE